MVIDNLFWKVGNVVGHVFSGVLAIDCVHNFSQGNYGWAIAEGVSAAYIQIKKKIERDEERRMIDYLSHLDYFISDKNRCF